MGYKMGLGQIKPESIDITGEPLKNLNPNWKPAVLL